MKQKVDQYITNIINKKPDYDSISGTIYQLCCTVNGDFKELNNQDYIDKNNVLNSKNV